MRRSFPFNYRMYSFPKDWIEYRLNELVELCERPIEMHDNQQYELVTVRRNFGGVNSRGYYYGREILVKSQFKLKSGDFIISKRQIAHGACGVVPDCLENAIVSNEYSVLIPTNCCLSICFFNYYVRLPFMKKYFFIMSDGVHIEKLLFKPQNWLKQKVTLPDYKQQQKIASIISTWDKAIGLKERLIEQKKEQKRGLMKKLLGGEVRLPGFHDEWKEYFLCELGDFKSSSVDKKVNLSERAVKLLNYMDVYNNRIIDSKIKFMDVTAKESQIQSSKLIYGDVLFTPSSETPDDIGHSAVFKLNNEVLFSYHLIRMRFKKEMDIDFKGYIFNVDYILKEFSKRATGATRCTLSVKDFGEVKIRIPENEGEQAAIGKILTTADKEIELLEKELDVLKLQKKGLMQLLLTGIVRVPT